MNKMTLRIMTVDLEGDFDTKNVKSLEKIVPKLLDLFDSRSIKATFFVVSELLDSHLNLILEIRRRGHEIASHSKTHSFLNSKNSLIEIQESKAQFEGAGIYVTGFRSPGFITANSHFEDLKKCGYSYDSSLAVFWPGRYMNFWLGFSPQAFVQESQETSGNKTKIVELPMPTFFWPLINSGLSYLRLFSPVSLLFRNQYMFYLHPWEFLEKSDLPQEKLKSFLGKLLQRNTGDKAWKIFEKFLDQCEKKKVEWVSCSEYIEKVGVAK